jgi:hypothetical protein
MSKIIEETRAPATNNTRLFRKIVRDFNEKTGFKFELPKDTDYSGKYAHPIHDDGFIVMRAQIDDEKDLVYKREVYGINLKIDGVSLPIRQDETYQDLKKLISTEAFKYRLEAIKQLERLNLELKDRIENTKHQIFDETIKDIEREDNYDLAIKTAKTLYKEDK